MEDAQTALGAFKKAADAVICVSNQRVMRMLDERTPLVELVAHANAHLVQAFRGLWQSLTQPGLIPVDFAHVEQLFRGRHAESCFASVEASGEHRVRDILEKMQQHPFLDQGAVLSQARTVLVSLAGGPDLTAPEVERLMDQLYRQCESAHVVTGAVVDESLKGSLRVTLIATWGGVSAEPEPVPAPTAGKPDSTAESTKDPLPDDALPAESEEDSSTKRGGERYVPAAPELDAEQRRRVLGRRSRGILGRKQPQQLLMAFDVVAKSRFDHTEPQRVKGQNLDIPTFIRRGIALN
jgi:cell division protein FtsZ